MTDRDAFGGAIILAGLGLLLAYVFWTAQESARFSEDDGPGPNLIINIEGEMAYGRIVIDLLDDVAPAHVERITTLAAQGAYDNVVFHRVIEGFMAQTGDVKFGIRDGEETSQAGLGGSDLPDLPAEFSDLPFERGTVGMARSASPDSANSQFFIVLQPAPHLNGEYTLVGRVIEGMEIVDVIKMGDPEANGTVENPDAMTSVTVAE